MVLEEQDLNPRVCGFGGITSVVLRSDTNTNEARCVCGRNELRLISRHLDFCVGQVTARPNLPFRG
jgi:hypothetical protein